MADAIRVLIVDDNEDDISAMRSWFESAEETYEVINVPSAEEASFELMTPFDLMITETELPGMGGIDLVKRVTKRRSEMHILFVTNDDSDEMIDKIESTYEDAGYCPKPIDLEDFADSVEIFFFPERVEERIAAREAEAAAEAAAAEAAAAGGGIVLPPTPTWLLDAISKNKDFQKRLTSLRTDTSAQQVTLAYVNGEPLLMTGDSGGLDLPTLTETIAIGFYSTVQLAEQLGNDRPLTMQYQNGQQTNVYAANVGRNYLLILFFSSSAKTRIGVILRFAQRAVNDFIESLSQLEPPADAVVEPAAKKTAKKSSASSRSSSKTTTKSSSRSQEPEPEPKPEPEPEPEPLAEEIADIDLGALDEIDWDSAASADVDDFWDAAVDEASSGAGNQLTLEEARKKGLVINTDMFEADNETKSKKKAGRNRKKTSSKSKKEDASEEDENLDGLLEIDWDSATSAEGSLDDFWDTAVAEVIDEENPIAPSGMTLEEAREKGLLPPEL
ncbi:MAG TPA: response regulator [Anaerolineae bacterium]|nr:response regulator [Anaerolineae bacterium]